VSVHEVEIRPGQSIFVGSGAIGGDLALASEVAVSLFDFEQLDVFKVAVEMVVCIDAIAEQLPTGRGYMRDQLRRAANSVPLNIAEGAGEYSPSEKARFYRIAKRSATEAAAQVIVTTRLGMSGGNEVEEARRLLHRLVSMLVRMIASCEQRRNSRLRPRDAGKWA
jgi:four helix bundle protein